MCNGTLATPFYNFDNIFQGLTSVFVLTAVDGWSNLLYAGMSSSGYMNQPQYDNSMGSFW